MKKHIVIIFFLVINIGANAQVTIGSNDPPMSGALLDLKEFSNLTGGVTATKGLLLPRVAIADINVLQIAPDSENEKHIGAVVYAISAEPDKPEENIDVCSSIPLVDTNTSGLMIWIGSEWKSLLAKGGESATEPSLPSWVHPDVKLSQPDHEGNSYTYRYFGNPDHQYITIDDFVSAGGVAADYQNYGYWMTENLRSTKYGSNHPNVELQVVQPGGNNASLLYGYPRKYEKGNSELDMRVDKDFEEFPSMGLLYSAGAIVGAVNGTVTSAANMQGICPDGWFIPCKHDWDELIAYLQTPEQQALYTNYETTPIAERHPSYTLTTECSTFMILAAVGGAKGKLSREGAFGLIAVGWGHVQQARIFNNAIFEYAETPDTGSVSGVPFRVGAVDITNVNSRYYPFESQQQKLANQMISVRCRTNVNPEL